MYFAGTSSSCSGDQAQLLAQYYDAMLSLTSWVQRRIMFRFPAATVDFEVLRGCAAENLISVRKKGKYVILDCCPYNEVPDGEWPDGERLLPSMLNLRRGILSGDFRARYLVWLEGVSRASTKKMIIPAPWPSSST